MVWISEEHLLAITGVCAIPASSFSISAKLRSATLREPSAFAWGRRSEPSGTRTRDPLIKSQMLYRPELTALRKNQKNANIYRLFSALKDPFVPEIVPKL
jgi:hypothetical protein